MKKITIMGRLNAVLFVSNHQPLARAS